MNFTCPQCGFEFAISHGLKCKLNTCSSCDSSLLIENNSISVTALNVAKNTEESLFEINNAIRIKERNYTPNGYCLYDYQDGRKVEWELTCTDHNANDQKQDETTYFLNQEDENLFLVKEIPAIKQTLPAWESLQANTHLTLAEENNENDWLVVEQLQVEFVSFFGALNHVPLQNVKLKCVYLSNTEGECLVISYGSNNNTKNHKAYQGWWLDPMDLT